MEVECRGRQSYCIIHVLDRMVRESNDWLMEVECRGRQSCCIIHVLDRMVRESND